MSIWVILKNSAGKQVGDEDLEEMIESGNPGVFTQGIITDTQQVSTKLFLMKILNWNIL